MSDTPEKDAGSIAAVREHLEQHAPTVTVPLTPSALNVSQEETIGYESIELDLSPSSDNVADLDINPQRQIKFDVEGFFADVHEEFMSAGSGYVIGLQFPGFYRAFRSYGYARKPTDGGMSWSPSVPTHVASASKFITAIAFQPILTKAGVDIETPITEFLPTYWNPHPSFSGVTLRQLLRHESGITTPDGVGSTRFLKAKEAVESGVNITDIGTHSYDNRNYALLRIILPVIEVRVLRSLGDVLFISEQQKDDYWDLTTRDAYEEICNRLIFSKVNADATLSRRTGSALAYSSTKDDEPGFNSGEGPRRGAGAVGWHINMTEWLDVLEGLYDGRVLSTASRLRLLSAYVLGNRVSSGPSEAIPSVIRTRGFGGTWGEGEDADPRRRERNFFLLSNIGYQAAVFMNCASPPPLPDIVTQSFHANISQEP